MHDSVRIADRLAVLFPAERVLIIVREQRAIILSTYRQYVNNGGLLSLDAYVAGGEWWWHFPFELREYAYDGLITHYHTRFGEENVLVLPYELLRRDGREFVSRIIEFTGAHADPNALDALPFGAFVNIARPAVSVVAKRRLNRFVRHHLTPWGRFRPGSRAGRLMLGVASRAGRVAPAALNGRVEARMRDTVASAVGDYYRESNARTGELIGFDLAEFGYDLPGGAVRPSPVRDQASRTHNGPAGAGVSSA
jgi:hypothetical protein